MLDQKLMEEAREFLQRYGGEPASRARRTPRDEALERLYTELNCNSASPLIQKAPSGQAPAGADSPAAAAAGDDPLPSNDVSSSNPVKLSQVVARLRRERELRGLSLGDIHDATGITRGKLSRLENGVETNPTIGTLDRIAEALGLRLGVTMDEATN